MFDVTPKEDGTTKPDHARARCASMETVTKQAQSEAGTSHKRRNSDKDIKVRRSRACRPILCVCVCFKAVLLKSVELF